MDLKSDARSSAARTTTFIARSGATAASSARAKSWGNISAKCSRRFGW